MGRVGMENCISSTDFPEFNFSSVDEARKYLIEKRKSLPVDFISWGSQRICSCVMRDEDFKKADSVACFFGVRGEPDTSEIIKSDKRVYLPVVRGGKIHFFRYQGRLEKGAFGIPEPISDEMIDVDEIDLFIVPGVIFDIRGFRIGYGKGYYDRALALIKKNERRRRIRKEKEKRGDVKIFALAWSFQVFRHIPYDKEHDVFVDSIFTEKFTVRCR